MLPLLDGVRLCKAARYRYKNNDMDDLENQLIEVTKQQHRFKIIVTDGVFLYGWNSSSIG